MDRDSGAKSGNKFFKRDKAAGACGAHCTEESGRWGRLFIRISSTGRAQCLPLSRQAKGKLTIKFVFFSALLLNASGSALRLTAGKRHPCRGKIQAVHSQAFFPGNTMLPSCCPV